jgi:hypothetical protein
VLLPVRALWAPEVPWRAGCGAARGRRRGGAWWRGGRLPAPLRHARPRAGRGAGTAAFAVEKHRTNDLFGFYWIGPKEESIVSWPTMLGTRRWR